MHATTTSSKPAPLPEELATVEELAQLALLPSLRDVKFTLAGFGAQAQRLEEAGIGTWSRRSGLRFILRGELAAAVMRSWKHNRYNTALGARTLATIVLKVGGPDLRPALRAAKAAKKAEEAAALDWVALCNLARNLHTALTERGPSEAFTQAQPTETRDALIVARAAMQTALDRLTRQHPAIALMVAYDPHGNPRGQ